MQMAASNSRLTIDHNNMQEVDGLEEGGGGESAVKREFERLDAGNGVVHMRDMPRLIQGALGRDVRPWIQDRILKMFEANRYNGCCAATLLSTRSVSHEQRLRFVVWCTQAITSRANMPRDSSPSPCM